MKIAFVGTGVMGQGMVANLLKAGHEVRVYTRTKAKADGLLALGAKWASSPAESARGAKRVTDLALGGRHARARSLAENRADRLELRLVALWGGGGVRVDVINLGTGATRLGERTTRGTNCT